MRIKKIFQFILVVLIFVFLGRKLLQSYEKLQGYEFSVNYIQLIISTVLYSFTIVINSILWFFILSRLLKQKASCFSTIKVASYAWVARYVPGKVVSLAGKVLYGEKELMISKREVGKSIALEYIFLILSSLTFFLLIIDLKVVFLLIIFIALILSFMFQSLRFYLIYVASRTFLGIAFFIFLASLQGTFPPEIWYMVASFVVASILGFLAVVTPGGLGVREGFLALFLSRIYPSELAIILAIAARVWVITGDLFLIVLVLTMDKIRTRKLQNGQWLKRENTL